jgi:hypothetical protein
VKRDGESDSSADRGDSEWKRIMELRSVRAAEQLSKEIAKKSKPGFSGVDNQSDAGWRAFQQAKEGVGELVNDEISVRIGKLVMRKDRELADAIAKDRVEAAFL